MIAIKQAEAADAPLVGRLVFDLLCEFEPELETPENRAGFEAAAADLLRPAGTVWAYIAFDGDEPVGVMTLNECASIYAGGRFGEISELYVVPGRRSSGVGPRLLDAARAFGRDVGWKRLEVGAPPMPAWKRSFDFYRRNGFTEVGPRLKQSL